MQKIGILHANIKKLRYAILVLTNYNVSDDLRILRSPPHGMQYEMNGNLGQCRLDNYEIWIFHIEASRGGDNQTAEWLLKLWEPTAYTVNIRFIYGH